MYIIVYFGDKPVYLCDEINKDINELLHHHETVFIDELSSRAIHALLHEIVKEEFHAGVIWNPDLSLLKKSFFKHFTLIEAAGGIVQNARKELLFIFRRGKWDLPKGKLDKKEKPEDAALREVQEETGADNLKLKKKIGETYHVYEEFGKKILKTTHWFYMMSANSTLKPQAEEDITEAKWVPTKDIRTPVSNTYASIKDILKRFFDEP